jgi:hypothetical protein
VRRSGRVVLRKYEASLWYRAVSGGLGAKAGNCRKGQLVALRSDSGKLPEESPFVDGIDDRQLWREAFAPVTRRSRSNSRETSRSASTSTTSRPMANSIAAANVG